MNEILLAVSQVIGCVIGVFICSIVIYATGILMNYISDNHKDKEWINSIIACIDLILIGISLVLIIRIIFVTIPYVLIFLTGVIVLGVIVLLMTFIIDKIQNVMKRH